MRILPENVGSVQTLAVTIDTLLSESNHGVPHWISVTVGPGSFTSLRVGVATAKMLALAWQIPLVGVDTLQALAWQACGKPLGQTQPGENQPIVMPVINAFRKQVFVAAWQLQATGDARLLAPSQVVDADRWIEQPLGALQTAERVPESSSLRLLVTGPGLANYQPIAGHAVTIAPQSVWLPRVQEVAWLGLESFRQGQGVDAGQLQLNYVRASAAEEQARASRQGS